MRRCCLLLVTLCFAIPLSAVVRHKPTPPLDCSHAVIMDAEGAVRAELRLTPRRALERLELELTWIDAVELTPDQARSWRFENLPAGETRSIVLPLAAPAPEGSLGFAYTTLSQGRRMGSGYRFPSAVTRREPIPDDAL